MNSDDAAPPAPRRYRASILRRGIRRLGVRLTAEDRLLVARSPFGKQEFRIGGSTAHRRDDRIVFQSPDGELVLFPWDARQIPELMTDLQARSCEEVTLPSRIQNALHRRERVRVFVNGRAIRLAAAIATIVVVGTLAWSSQRRWAIITAAMAVAGGELVYGEREDRRDPKYPDLPTTVATWKSGLITLASVAVVGALLLPDLTGVATLGVVVVFGGYWARTRRWPIHSSPRH